MREEMHGHVLQASNIYGCLYILFPLVSLWSSQVSVEIFCHQQRCPGGALAYGQDDAVDRVLVVGHDVAPNNETVPAYICHLKDRHIRPMRLVGLNLEMGGVAVEDNDTTLIPDQCFSREDVVPCQHARVDPVGNLGLLEEPHVYIGLSHSPH